VVVVVVGGASVGEESLDGMCRSTVGVDGTCRITAGGMVDVGGGYAEW
jgi:hypothetical protein